MSRAEKAYATWAAAMYVKTPWAMLTRVEQQAWELAADAAGRWSPAREPAPARADGRVERYDR